MSSYDKVVKMACKPKAAPPKAKYLDPIIAATWSDDGAVHDVCKALSPRFREPNSVVVFKALIVLHTMIRNGATDNVLSYLSSSEVLRLQNVSAGNWEGYAAPQNLQNYAVYLDSRIRAYRDLKHDAIRVQAESNRDMRNSASVEEDNYARGKKKDISALGPQRSKTIMGRKLRVMTVEKGLLRETKAVHRMIDSLVECKFYLDDLEDELTTTALRMLVKDLLILFQAGNEGVINVLEHYFEMSHVDAEQALALYRHFCKQTERVVEYLGVAKKLQNILNVPIPNLKHAPVSLAGALDEYLSDPNFEQNRIEYKTNKEAAQRGRGTGSTSSKPASSPAPPLPLSTPSQATPATSPTPANAQMEPNKAVSDFFSGIEEEQSTLFNPQTNSPSTAYFQQQGAANPFTQMGMAPQFGQPQMQVQPTGVVAPQQVSFQQVPNPFGMMQQQSQPPSHLRLQPQATGHRPFSSFLPQQATGMPQQQNSFLPPQATGANPFRQSMLMPQTTGMAMFGVGGMQQQPHLFPQQQLQPTSSGTLNGATNGLSVLNGLASAQSSSSLGSSSFSSFMSAGPFSQQSSPPSINVPARPASTPLTAFGSTQSSSAASPPPAQPVKTHQTGTRNPFGPISTPPPPVPKQPSLMELAMGMGGQNGNVSSHQQQSQQQQIVQGAPQLPQQTGFGSFSFNLSALSPGVSDMSSVASSFSFGKPDSTAASGQSSSSSGPFNALNSQSTSTTTGSTFSDSLFSSSLSSQPTGATNNSSLPSISFSPAAPLRSQTTGFNGLKPFKPSSSFGASLLESLPSIPGSSPATPAVTGTPSMSPLGRTTSGFANGLPSGTFGSQPTGLGQISPLGRSTLGQGLRPQMTGGGANPFRASMFSTMPNGASVLSMPTGIGGVGGNGAIPNSTLMGGSMFGPSFQNGNSQQQQQHHQQGTSLI
ncbi:ANTH-domain-containing protein [Lentinula lateritia]|uniref:ANTH-domain-containing protein n=1 Tax=Lentinula aff. lateritia TaxID=2804960 RepID=A0ACC1U6F4_9AGAR|nr:ANTH-domain-containing protein [Lentinula aff. lateritia]KAJ3850894.1 ANTH-domain-containing protein [Lentinula lateritia]